MKFFSLFLISIVVLLAGVESRSGKSKFYEARKSHKSLQLNESEMKQFSIKSDYDHINKILNEILIPRVVGSDNHGKVANFIVKELQDLDWDVERHSFEDNTPYGKLRFENIIAKLNPNADRFLVLACHYDSKYMRENSFLGATDSAVPCAMMLNLAKTLQNELSEIKSRNDVSLAFIFFDGEEAFKSWGPNDSIYGARKLASKWDDDEYRTNNGDVTNHNDRIDVLILLDLIGTPDPKFYSYFTNTNRWYDNLVNIERDLAEMGMLRSYAPNSPYFVGERLGAHIEDDHIPFLIRDVPILHIIPTPFPSVWHQLSDNRDALHEDTIENLNKIFRTFVAEYLHLKL